MIDNVLLIFDLETSHSDPESCHILQMSALAVDASVADLPILEGGQFNVFMRPDLTDEQIMDPEIIKKGALDKNGIQREDILNFPSEKQSWQRFVQFCNLHSKNKTMIPCGYNIINFDNIIVERYRKKYNTKKLWHNIAHVDLLQEMYLWLENVDEVKALSLDYLREYMGLDNTQYGATHNALRDCYDCYEMVKRIIQWRRQLIWKKVDGKRVCRFKDCFKG